MNIDKGNSWDIQSRRLSTLAEFRNCSWILDWKLAWYAIWGGAPTLGKAAASRGTPRLRWALLAGDGLTSRRDARATGLGALFLGEFQDYFDVAAAVEAGDGAGGRG
jgi:hypothetical protein